MKKHKLMRRITALILVFTMTFSCLSLTSYAVPSYEDPSVRPSLSWPYFTSNGGRSSYYDYDRAASSQAPAASMPAAQQTNIEDLKPIDTKQIAHNLRESLKGIDGAYPQKRDENSFLEKLKTEYVKSKIPDLIKETVKGGVKKVGKWIDKGWNGAKNWLNKGKASVNWFSKVMGKAAAKWAGRYLYLKGIYDYLKDPSAPFISPYLKLCAAGIKGINTFVGPFLPPNVGLALTAAEVIFTSSEMVNFLNDLYVKILKSDRPIKHLILFPDYVVGSLYIGGVLLFSMLQGALKGEKPVPKSGDSEASMLLDLQTKQKGASPTANGIGVYKPNIYLYPEKEENVSVTFAYPELLTVTDPPYESGWNAQAKPDGTLESGGSEYGYLFYESTTFPGFYQKNEGFVIPGGSRRETFTSILKAYGLNDTEIDDFCDFWCEKLEKGKDYAMYPQLTEKLDETMPVTITPTPDSVFRVWFLFSEGETPKTASKPEAFEREGFAVVEWGGMVFDN